MNPKLKLLITIIIIVGLLALFFWATNSISRLTGPSIAGTAVGNPVGIDTNAEDSGEVSVDELNTNSDNSNDTQDSD
jgi:lipoprotein signal peptidase